MSITSHSNTLSFTSPHEIPGRSFACCIPFSCRARSPAAPVAGAAGILASFTEAGYDISGSRVRGERVRRFEGDANYVNSKVYLTESRMDVFVGFADASCALPVRLRPGALVS
jgi:hypothetical protein